MMEFEKNPKIENYNQLLDMLGTYEGCKHNPAMDYMANYAASALLNTKGFGELEALYNATGNAGFPSRDWLWSLRGKLFEGGKPLAEIGSMSVAEIVVAIAPKAGPITGRAKKRAKTKYTALHIALDQDPVGEKKLFSKDRKAQADARKSWIEAFNRTYSGSITGDTFGEVLRGRKEAKEKNAD